MANYKISQLPAYDQPVAADDLLAAVDTSFGTTKKLTTAQLFTDAGLTGLTTADSIDFNAGAAGGELSWNSQEKTLDLVTGSDNVTLQLGQEVTLYARNNSGATMSDGQVVMISGSQGNNPTIALAQADTVENARKAIGVVTQVIQNNSNGFVTLIGKVRDLVLDDGTYTEGDVVYLSDTVAGGLTAVEPAIKVDVGHVLATSNGGNTNGVLEVQINNNAGTGGTVSSVSVTGGTGITSTGSPVTSSGTINVELDAATQATLSNVATNTAKVGITFIQASEIAANTAKVGITPTQASDITANNAKVGITPTQASEITANTAKVSAEWGNITGTLTSQTDLQSALDTNSIAIFNHAVEILRNANNIATNTSNIATNTYDIENIATVVTGLVTSGDNSSTIQAVINSVAASGGGDIVIPAGTWEIASTLVISTSNVRLRGAGGGWSQDVGVQGTQAATTLKWIGTEFDGAVVISGSLDGVGAGVTKNGTRLGTVNGFATSDVSKYQGMLIEHVSSGVYDLIMHSDNGYVEIKAASNAAWADSQSFKLYKPSVMVEVKSVYGNGTTDQQITGSGVSQIHFDCQDAHIGLRVIAALNGVYEDLSFIEAKTAAVYMGVKNIGTMDKPATQSQDAQFNSFARIVSRNFTTGEYGGLLVGNGMVGWGSNTSFNNFDDMRAFIRHGDGLIFGSFDANRLHNALVLRVTGTGDALKFLGSNSNVNDVPRNNRLTQFCQHWWWGDYLLRD